jgi:hypothetical protein
MNDISINVKFAPSVEDTGFIQATATMAKPRLDATECIDSFVATGCSRNQWRALAFALDHLAESILKKELALQGGNK